MTIWQYNSLLYIYDTQMVENAENYFKWWMMNDELSSLVSGEKARESAPVRAQAGPVHRDSSLCWLLVQGRRVCFKQERAGEHWALSIRSCLLEADSPSLHQESAQRRDSVHRPSLSACWRTFPRFFPPTVEINFVQHRSTSFFPLHFMRFFTFFHKFSQIQHLVCCKFSFN